MLWQAAICNVGKCFVSLVFALLLNLSNFETLSKLNLLRYGIMYSSWWQIIFRKESMVKVRYVQK